jgi:uncharacterized protein involved in copper resistance
MALIHGFMIAAAMVVGAPEPQQPAAPAGKEVCAGCHDQVVAQFDRSAHSALVLKEGDSQIVGCEACHGNGAKPGEPVDVTVCQSGDAEARQHPWQHSRK